MSLRFRVSFLVVILFLVATLNALFTFWLESLGDEKLNWVNHTHEVLYTTEKLLGSMKDMETGQRGYLLTKNASYLEPYYNGSALVKEELAKLKRLTADNPAQQELLVNINKQVQYKFDELDQTILLVQEGKNSEALKIVLLNKGKQYMDNIRSYFSTFNHSEALLLEKRKGAFMEHRAQITTLIFVEIALVIGLAIITFLFLHKSLFAPLQRLVQSAEKIENGRKLEVADILEKDEMGHLFTAFYEMSNKVYEREQLLNYEAKHDSLTGLKNRTTVLHAIEESVLKSQESKNKTAILFMDLNLFKQINDSMGHDVGDIVLKETALRLKDSIRSGDTVFRLGGDEFLIILNNIEDVHNVVDVMQKIQQIFKVPAKINGNMIDISISIGASISPDDSINSAELIEFADVAMYAAKRDKKAAYKCFERGMLKRAGDIIV